MPDEIKVGDLVQTKRRTMKVLRVNKTELFVRTEDEAEGYVYKDGVEPIPPAAPTFDGLLAWARANLPDGYQLKLTGDNTGWTLDCMHDIVVDFGDPYKPLSQQLIAAVQHARREAGLEPAGGPG